MSATTRSSSVTLIGFHPPAEVRTEARKTYLAIPASPAVETERLTSTTSTPSAAVIPALAVTRDPSRCVSRTRIASTPGWRRPVGPQARNQWRRWESNPTQDACEAPSPPRHMRPHSLVEVGTGVEPGLPRLPGWRAAAILPDLPVAEASFFLFRSKLILY